MFNVINNKAPEYLKEMVTKRSAKPQGLRANNDQTLLDKKSHAVKYKISERRLSVAGPQLWNQLPRHMREVASEDLFKVRLKTHLFQKAYGE